MKKTMRSVIAAMLVVAALFSIACFACADTKTVSQGSPSNGRAVTVTTKTDTSKVYPVVESQVRHQKGISTTVSTSRSVTKTDSVSASITSTFGADCLGLTSSVAAQVGVSTSQSFTVGTTIAFTVGADKESGMYRIEVVFPEKVTSIRVQKWNNGTSNYFDKTATFKMPIANGSFTQLTRYSI